MLPILHGDTPNDGHVLLGLGWLELATLLAVFGILAGAVWAWVAGSRLQRAAAEADAGAAADGGRLDGGEEE